MPANTAVNEPVQRVGILSEVPDLVVDLGYDPAEVLFGLGIAPDDLRPDQRIPYRSCAQLLQRAVKVTGCPHFGLLLGQRFRMDLFGPIGRLMMSATTIAQALGDFVSRQPGYSSGATVYLHRLERDFTLGYGVADPGPVGVKPIYDVAVGVGVQMLHILSAGKVRPVEVHIGYREPASQQDHYQAIRVPVRFDQQRTCLILDEAAMRTVVPTGSPEARRIVLTEVEQAMRPTPSSVSSRVRQILRHRIQLGDASMAGLSEEIGLHPRTLRRRLADEGTTFEMLRDEVRYMVSRELLELTDLSVGDISMAVAMASPGVFSEAFRRWSGAPPSRWRPEVS